MKTVFRIHNAQERRQARLMADRLCHRSLLRLLVCASVLLNALTQVVPHAGSASWWLVPALLVPGIVLHLLLCLLLRGTGTRSLPECLGVLLGDVGRRICMLLLALMVLVDAAASLTSLVCLFTEGIDTEGTQITISLLTCAALLWCLDQNGLPRGMRLFRCLLLGMMALLALDLLSMAHWDHLYPVLGGGRASLVTAARAGMSLSWPLILLLGSSPVRENTPVQESTPIRQSTPVRAQGGHARELIAPLLLVVAANFALIAAVPHEVLMTCSALAESLVLPVQYLHPAAQTLGQCLLMLGLFLLVACQLHTLSELALVRGKVRKYLPHGLLLLLLGTQLIPTVKLWSVLSAVRVWFIVPAALLVLCLCLVRALMGRRHP